MIATRLKSQTHLQLQCHVHALGTGITPTASFRMLCACKGMLASLCSALALQRSVHSGDLRLVLLGQWGALELEGGRQQIVFHTGTARAHTRGTVSMLSVQSSSLWMLSTVRFLAIGHCACCHDSSCTVTTDVSGNTCAPALQQGSLRNDVQCIC